MRIPDRQPTPSLPPAARPSPTRGALILVDSFQSSSSHGHLVEGAAGSLGPTGHVERIHQHQQVNGKASLPHVQALVQLQSSLAQPGLSVEQARRELEQFVVNAAGGNLNWASQLLEQVTARGYQQSVLNYSQGMDAIMLLQLVKHPLGASSKLPAEQQAHYRSNLALATAAPVDQERDFDNAVLQALKQHLQQSPGVQSAVEGWRENIRKFESNHNSVVVAAGNSGQAQKALKHAGFAIDGSEDANLFAVPEATVVGATAVDTTAVGTTATNDQGQVVLASPSGFGPEVDFLAGGEFGEHFGTSFSCPKVANALRAAHLAHPEMSSDQVEAWSRTNLADPAQIGEHRVALLDEQRVRALFSQLEDNL